MPNVNHIFLTKFIIFFILFSQSFNCQANKFLLQKGDSLFNHKKYQEAMIVYEELLQQHEVYSNAMLLKMAFISEGKGDFGNASFYLAKYYDQNPNPNVINKVKALTGQNELYGYEIDDWERFLKILDDYHFEITAVLAFVLLINIILLIVTKNNSHKPRYYFPMTLLILLIFISNNFLHTKRTGIVTGSPTLIMDSPTSAGVLLDNVDPGHRIVIKSSKDIWYEILWKDQKAYIKQEQVTPL
jgi:tetratricopeptide (TPR) repeat protein